MRTPEIPSNFVLAKDSHGKSTLTYSALTVHVLERQCQAHLVFERLIFVPVFFFRARFSVCARRVRQQLLFIVGGNDGNNRIAQHSASCCRGKFVFILP